MPQPQSLLRAPFANTYNFYYLFLEIDDHLVQQYAATLYYS